MFFKSSLIFLISMPLSGMCVDWSPIHWNGPKRVTGEQVKESLLIEAKIEDSTKPFYFQLDTGAEVSMLFLHSIAGNVDLVPFFGKSSSVPVPDGYPNALEYGIKLKGTIANNPFSKEPFLIHKLVGVKNSPLIGMVGLSAFSSPVLAIDFVGNRVAALSDVQQIEHELNRPVMYQTYTVINGLPTLPIFSSKKLRGNFVIDTGSSQFGLIVFDDAIWMEMTGRKINDPKNTKINGATWGYQLNCIGAPSLTDVELKKISLGKIDLAYCLENNRPMKISGSEGLLGNAAFFDRAMLIFDQSSRRVGISMQETNEEQHEH
jgi:hypothetical protein